MKIVDVQTFLVENVPPYQGGRRWLFVKLITDEGIEGIGEWSTGQTGREKSSIEIIKDLATQFVIGADPFKIELLWQKIYATDHDFRHPGLALTPALSAIEMACWDIVGKALNQPVYNLLGGQYHEKLRAYAYMPHGGVWENPEKAGEIAADLMEKGNTAMKFDPFPIFPAPRDIPLKDIARVGEIFKCIRDAVGYEVEVGLGTHGQLTTSSAIRIAQMIEPYYPFWFEEPVSLENVDEMARVASHTSIPIATGERLLTKYEFVEVFQKQAAQIIQLDVGHCGGILESKKIASTLSDNFCNFYVVMLSLDSNLFIGSDTIDSHGMEYPMRVQKYKVVLSAKQRKRLKALSQRGQVSARKLARAHILLLADQNRPQWAMNDNQIHQILNVSQATVIRVRKKFATCGLEAAIEELSRCGRPLTFDGYQRAQVTALACSTPPEGQSQWSLRLLADQLVELGVVEAISHETVGVILKKTN